MEKVHTMFFTSVPVVLMGVLDQDVTDRVSLAVPELYRRGIERLEWTQTKFWWVFFFSPSPPPPSFRLTSVRTQAPHARRNLPVRHVVLHSVSNLVWRHLRNHERLGR